MQTFVWCIRDWDKHYETAETRKLKRQTWVAVPNKHDGRGFRRLMGMPNGVELFGAWNLILQVASKMPVRGILADEDGPLSAEDIADKVGAPNELIAEALEAVSSERINWIFRKPLEFQEKAGDSQERIEGNGRVGSGLVGNGISSIAAAVATTTGEEIEQVRKWLLDYTAAFQLRMGKPDDLICRRVIAACNGRPLSDLQDLLIAKCEAGQRPRKSWAWFETVAEANFGTSR